MAKRHKKKGRPEWMKKVLRKVKVGLCYWERYVGLQIVREVRVDEEKESIHLLTSRMEICSPDGYVRETSGFDYIGKDTPLSEFKKVNPEKMLQRNNNHWRKIYKKR